MLLRLQGFQSELPAITILKHVCFSSSLIAHNFANSSTGKSVALEISASLNPLARKRRAVSKLALRRPVIAPLSKKYFSTKLSALIQRLSDSLP